MLILHKRVLFLVLLFTSFISTSSRKVSSESCNDMKVNVVFDEDMVKINTSNGVAPYTYFFCDNNNLLLNPDTSQDNVSDLRRGEYKCTVIDFSGCQKVVTFRID